MTITNGYATLAQLRSELGNYAASDTSDDSKMELSIETASRAIDDYCHDRFWQDSNVTARTFIPDNPRCLDVTDSPDGAGISTANGLLVKLDTDDSGSYETSLTITTDFLLRPVNAGVVVPAEPFTEIYLTGASYYFSRSLYGRALVEVTAKWGWASVPDQVEKACLIIAADLFKSKDAPFGVVGSSEFGQLRISSSVARMAQMLLGKFREPAVA